MRKIKEKSKENFSDKTMFITINGIIIESSDVLFKRLTLNFSIMGKFVIFFRYHSKTMPVAIAKKGPAGRKYLNLMFGNNQYKGKFANSKMMQNVKSSFDNPFLNSFLNSLFINGMRKRIQGVNETIPSNGYFIKCMKKEIVCLLSALVMPSFIHLWT